MNNAISDDAGSGRDTHVDTIDNETWDEIMLIALKGTLWASKYAVPEMRKAGSGSIVNISASSSVGAIPTRPAYQASKGAINAMTRQMAVDYGKDDIRANTIIVGFIYTGSPGMKAILDNPEARAAFEKNIMDHIAVYGPDNDKRLTGKHETAPWNKFSYGVADRGASIRVPHSFVKNGYKGYLEDRRPNSQGDPYQIASQILKTISAVPAGAAAKAA